ncbi:TonB-dependent receptor [Sphingomonas alba]|uniref:TonB-dependent receptor n=1 Tax=Sphingomonas alba TaxID=2908208 RepID=A0ABT0RND7_9SPHN|nr:TonB-dependent receptor [Sphingomonas alba]MCL6684161.1 TonB-dependent receptor [Sphingomonas alba]
MTKFGQTSRFALLASAAGFCLTISGAAFAQDTAATTVAVAQDPTAEGGSAASDQSEEKIVVTAQKRAEAVLDVPASVSVISGDRLEKAHAYSLSEYATYVPGLIVGSAGTPGQTSIALRGVSSELGVGGATVGTYIGDLPLGSSSAYARSATFALDLLPYDLDRIEVLRGPQGTLYGASSMGGILSYNLRPADLDQLEFRVGGELDSINGAGDLGWGVRGTANVPIVTDKVAARLSLFKQKTPGYINTVTFDSVDGNGVPAGFHANKDDVNEVEQTGGRLALQVQINPQVNLKLEGLVQKTRADGNASIAVDRDDFDPLVGDRDLIRYMDEPFKRDVLFFGATFNADLDFATFTSATSYSKYDIAQRIDATVPFGLAPNPGVLADLLTDISVKKFTQEARLASPTGGTFEWLVGAFYTNEDAPVSQALSLFTTGSNPTFLFTNLSIDLPTTFEEFALFGDVTVRPFENFEVTGGLRWAHNTQNFSQEFNQFDGVSPDPVFTLSADGTSKESVVTWMANARYHFTPDIMAYARVATGYRPGGPNVVVPLIDGPPTFEADKLINYEAGLKGSFFEHRVDLELSAYHIDWKNIQIPVQIFIFTGADNGGKAAVNGVEFNTLYRPFKGARIGFNGAYTDAQLTEDSNAGPDGARLPLIPKWSWSLNADYSFRIAQDWNGRVGGGLRYVGKRAVSVQDGGKLPSYTLLDLTAGVSHGPWELGLFARNLTDERAYLGTTDYLQLGLNFADVTINQPRTFGISLDTRF